MEAAPRAEEAFPPRSRVLAITGAASGVQTEAASTFRPRTSGLLPLDLRIAERRALFVMPVDPLLLRGDVNEGEGVLARQQRAAAGQFRQELPVHLLQLQHVP